MEKEPHMPDQASLAGQNDRTPDNLKSPHWLGFMLLTCVLVVAFFCGLLFWGAKPHDELDVTRSTQVQPGQMFFTEDHYHLSSQGAHVAEYLLDVSMEQWRQFPQLLIETEFRNEQVWAQLMWKHGDEVLATAPIKSSAVMLVHLPKSVKENPNDDITTHIRFGPLLDLGAAGDQRDFVFKQMRLTTDSASIRWQGVLGYWQAFTPLRASSLNYWSIQDVTPLTAWLLVLFLTVWLLAAWWLSVSVNGLAGFVLVMWLVASLPWAMNHWKNKQFIDERFQRLDSGINDEDQQIILFSEQLKSHLEAHQMADTPVMVALRGDFHRSRMAYHLHDLNVFMLSYDTDLDSLKQRKSVDHVLILTSEAVIKGCDLDQSRFTDWQKGEVIWQMAGYCVVKR